MGSLQPMARGRYAGTQPMPVEVIPILTTPQPDAAIDAAVRAIDAGRLVVLPTETVYGAAGRLDVAEGVRRLRALRGDASGPFTIHVADADAIEPFVGRLSDLARRMVQKLWPGPVALVFDVPADLRAAAAARLGLDESDLYQDGAITLRCPDHRTAAAVLSRAGGPVALTRIETHGGDAPFNDATLAALPEADVALVLDAGRTRYSKPSTIVKIDGDSYRVVREGVFDERIIARQLKTQILFVCSGNTCRSPMAWAIATKQLKEALAPGPDETLAGAGIEVVSAGTFAMPGLRATPQAVEAVAELGADLSAHRSRLLTQELIHSSDFIVTMGRAHAQAVLAQSPAAADRLLMLDPSGDVEDPIGGDLALYRSVAQKFESLIADRLAETVLALHPPRARA